MSTTGHSLRIPLVILSLVVACQLGANSPASAADQRYAERPDDLPATRSLSNGSVAALAAPVERNGYRSIQVNVDAAAANIVGDAANEPSIAINPLDPSNIVIAWRQFDSTASNFRQSGFAYSFDGGMRWTFPGAIVPGVFYSDPVLRANADGEFFYAGVTSRPGEPGGTPFLFSDLFRSSDGGISWTGPVEAVGGDKHWLAIDSTGGVGNNNLYLMSTEAIDRDCESHPLHSVVPADLVCSNGNSVFVQCTAGECCLAWSSRNADVCCPSRVFTRSTDGGESFEPRVALFPSDQPFPVEELFWPYPYNRTVEVGNNGEVYVGGATNGEPLVPGPSLGSYCLNDAIAPQQVVFRSDDAQHPGIHPTFDYGVIPIEGTLGITRRTGIVPNPAGNYGDLVLKTDRSEGDRNGFLYALASVDPDKGLQPTGTDPRDVMFSRSEDGGTTWSAPVRVNDDASGNGAWQWFATMSVAPTGRIDAVWNDTRNGNGDSRLSELYYSYSRDGGATWAPNTAVSPQWNSHIGWPNDNKIGDYYDIESDRYGAAVAYAATHNGEQDVYFLRVYPDCNQDHRADLQNIDGLVSSDVDQNHTPDECEGLLLLVDEEYRSGASGFVVGGATPGGKVALYASDTLGVSHVAFCEEGTLGLSNPYRVSFKRAPVLVDNGLSVPVYLKAKTDRNPKGRQRRSGSLRYLQAVDLTTCQTSNILEIQPPRR